MKGADRLQKILARVKSGRFKRKVAQGVLLNGRGALNRAAFNIAVEMGLCVVCSKWKGCVVRDHSMYEAWDTERQQTTGVCTWFEAMPRVTTVKASDALTR